MLVDMVKQMVLTIFVIPVTLGAETKFQVVPVQLCPPADGALMLCNALRSAGGLLILPLPVYLSW